MTGSIILDTIIITLVINALLKSRDTLNTVIALGIAYYIAKGLGWI